MNRAHSLLQGRWFHNPEETARRFGLFGDEVRGERVVGMQLRGKATQVECKTVEFTVDVLAHVDPAGPHMRYEFLKCYDLLLWVVPAVVDDDVHDGHVLAEPLPESAIGLIAHEDASVLVFVDLARIVDVDAVNMALRTKVVPP